MNKSYTHFSIAIALLVSINFALAQQNPSGDVNLHMITTGQPLTTKFVGDQLNPGSTYYINYEIGQASWYQSDAGIGTNNVDPADWNWRSATWYEDGSYPNKKVHADFGNFRFTQSGNWFFCGRAKADHSDPWNYANSDEWGSSDVFDPQYYIQVEEIPIPGHSSVFYPNETNPSSAIDLEWIKNGEDHNVLIVRKISTDVWDEYPVQGTPYEADDILGNTVVVYNGDGTSFTDNNLSEATTYDYLLFSANNNYYSIASAAYGYTSYANGDGTASSPYQVATAQALNTIRYFQNSLAGEGNFKQTANIDLTEFSTGLGWVPLPVLKDSYDGQGYTISNLKINNHEVASAGLFEKISTGVIKNVGLININIKSGMTAGALAGSVNIGQVAQGIQVENCYATGAIEIIEAGFGASYVGGLVGNLNADMKKCYSTCTITINHSDQHQYIGGLVGYLSGSKIEDSYFKGTLDCNTAIYVQFIGGVVGQTIGNIKNCYAVSPISYFPVEYYNWIGGVAGQFYYTGVCTNSFYDADVIGITNYASYDGEKTTAEMKDINTYNDAGWDFTTTWDMNESVNNGYPFLQTGAPSPVLTWDGSESNEWANALNWSPETIPTAEYDVVIDNVTNDPVVNQGPGSAAVCNKLTINSGAVLTIASGKAITVMGTLINNSGNSGLVIGNGASIIHSTSGVASTVTSSFSGPKWHFISSPVSDATSELFTGKYLQTLDENSQQYFDITETNIPLTPAQGFAVWSSEAGVSVNFSGALNTGNKSISTTAGSYVDPEGGFNLVGNPYPCSLDWTLCSRTNLNNAIYIEKDGQWATFVDGVGDNGGTKYIAPGQGFLVQATDAGSLSMANSAKAHNTTTFFKDQPVVPNLIRLELAGNGYSDEAVIRFNLLSTEKFDGEYDALKLYSDAIQIPHIYTIGGTLLSINSLPETSMVPVGVKTGTTGSYTIAATEINDMPYVSLEDTKTGIFTELAKSSYTFNFTSGENELRFKLHFSALSVNEEKEQQASIYSYRKTAYINLNTLKQADIYIYNTAGQLIYTRESAGGLISINMETGGVYIVKVISNNDIQNKKIFINQ